MRGQSGWGVFWRRWSQKASPSKVTGEQRPLRKEGEGSVFLQRKQQVGHVLGTMRRMLPSEGGRSNIKQSQGRGQALLNLVEDGKELEFYS